MDIIWFNIMYLIAGTTILKFILDIEQISDEINELGKVLGDKYEPEQILIGCNYPLRIFIITCWPLLSISCAWHYFNR